MGYFSLPRKTYTVVVYVNERYPSTGYSAGGQHVRPIKRTFDSEEAYDAYCMAIEDLKCVAQTLMFKEDGSTTTDNRRPGDRQVDA